MPADIDLKDRNFWHRYSASADGRAQMGIVPVSHQTYRFTSPAGERISRSMLTIFELSLLYALGRHFYTGQGLIVDAGPLLGASTFALARGLSDNADPDAGQSKARIYSYDLFSNRGYDAFLGAQRPIAVTGSLLPEFIATNAAYLDRIVIHQGDFLDWTWPSAPVEIFFLDLAKTWSLNSHAIKEYFPSLIPGKSILIQQDYIHFNEYWIHITMEYYKEYFDLMGLMYGATAFYRCVKQFEKDDFIDLEKLPYATKMELLTAARAKADPLVQQVMKSAAAKCAIENGRPEDARSLLQSVDLSVKPSHPTLDVSGIARSNLDIVAKMLDRALAA